MHESPAEFSETTVGLSELSESEPFYRYDFEEQIDANERRVRAEEERYSRLL